ncbi:MAG TPA: SDR family oxidoreductase [Polyangiaceae bacterium]|jgi:NAD(P)-dependent dehydrogenase (short-subunit alcohol dehydrogenase family)|nr:SDR family oxidoreductase [Polyangiaceae bacterium]
MDLGNRTALVTGASRGLGRSLAERIADAGGRVVLVARDEAAVEAAARAIRQKGGVAFAIAADIGDKESAHRIAGQAAALAGSVDVLVHNASTLGPVPLAPLLDTACEDLERAFAVNVLGPFRLTKLLAGPMALRGAGVVVHVTSDASVSAYPGWGAYGITKAALDHLTRIWAAELEGTGVKLLAVDPGEMDTRMHADAMPDADRGALQSPDTVAERIVRLIAGERWKTGARLEASGEAAQ